MADIVDPFAAPAINDPFAAPPSSKDSVARDVAVAGRAASPYAAAATTGALMGAPFGGIPGAIGGAGLGVLSLGLSDLASGLYNIAAPRMGTPTVTPPSTAIKEGYGALFNAAAPETARQRMVEAGVSGAVGGGAQAAAFNRLAPAIASPLMQNAMRSMGNAPMVQTGAGLGAGLGSQGMEELGYGPLGQLGGALVGGLTGGSIAQGAGRMAQARQMQTALKDQPSSAKEQRDLGRASYKIVDDADLAYNPSALSARVDSIKSKLDKTRYIPETDVTARNFLDLLEERAKSPQSLTQLDALRSKARNNIAKTEDGEQQVFSLIYKELNDAFNNLNINNLLPRDPQTHVVTPAVVKRVNDAIREGRERYKLAAKSETLENLVHAAGGSPTAATDPVRALQVEFSKLAKNQDALKQFTEAEQNFIHQVAMGDVGPTTIRFLERLSPGISKTNMLGNAAAAMSGAIGGMLGGPLTGIAATTIPGVVARAAKTARGERAVPSVNQFIDAVRAGSVQAPYQANTMARTVPIGMEYLRSQE